jgi:hypothetical protein
MSTASVQDAHQPISIKVTYTDSDNQTVEQSFRSLYKASKQLSISIPTLKELYLGGNPKLHDNVPKNITVVRIDTLPKPPPKPKTKQTQKPTKTDPDIKWRCEICNKEIKLKSKYEHVTTMGHLKKKAQM